MAKIEALAVYPSFPLRTLTRIKRDGRAVARHCLAPVTLSLRSPPWASLGLVPIVYRRPSRHSGDVTGTSWPSRPSVPTRLNPHAAHVRVKSRTSCPLACSDVLGDIVAGCILSRISFNTSVFKYKAVGCSSFKKHKYPFFLLHSICVWNSLKGFKYLPWTLSDDF